jgi:hypothetical protein
VSEKFHGKCDDCPDQDLCHLKPAFADIREKTFEIMSRITIGSLINNVKKQ